MEIKCSSGRSRKVKQEKARGETQDKELPCSTVPQSSLQPGSLAGVYLLSSEYCVKLFCSPELYHGNLTKRSDLEVSKYYSKNIVQGRVKYVVFIDL